MIRKILIFGVLACLLVMLVGDLGAKGAVENQLSARVEKAVPSSGGASVDVSSFPFLGRLAVAGQVSRVKVRVEGVTVGRLRFSAVSLDLHDVRLDRNQLLSDRRAVLRSIGRSSATAEIRQDDLVSLVGVPVRLEKGRATVTVEGRPVVATATVHDNVLRLAVGNLSIPPITLPKIPCSRASPTWPPTKASSASPARSPRSRSSWPAAGSSSDLAHLPTV